MKNSINWRERVLEERGVFYEDEMLNVSNAQDGADGADAAPDKNVIRARAEKEQIKEQIAAGETEFVVNGKSLQISGGEVVLKDSGQEKDDAFSQAFSVIFGENKWKNIINDSEEKVSNIAR